MRAYLRSITRCLFGILLVAVVMSVVKSDQYNVTFTGSVGLEMSVSGPYVEVAKVLEGGQGHGVPRVTCPTIAGKVGA